MNRIYQGDNLAILREIPDTAIDLIATDPPFNTGKDWGAFNDKWEGGLKGYLKFMEQRCVEMHRVLKDTGSFYLHCDPRASHYLKVMLDGIFGIKRFRNEIVWCYRKWATKSKHFTTSHDIILFYSKTDNFNWNQLLEPLSPKNKHKFKMNSKVLPNGKRIYGHLKVKSDGAYMRDIWDLSVINSQAKERVGYPTQKPFALYERIIKASSNQGDIVLDPFAGSGTTLDAAHTLGRHWIGIDQSDQSIEIITQRLRNRHGLEHDRDYELATDTSRLK